MPYGAQGLFRAFVTENVAGPTTAAQNLFGSRNVTIGFGAAQNAGTNPTNAVDDSVFVGRNAGQSDQATEVVIVGSGAALTLVDPGHDGSTIMGAFAADAVTSIGTGALGVAGSLTVIGRNALGAAQFANNLVVIGDGALSAADPATAAPVRRSVVIGRNAVSHSLAVGRQINDNVIIGHDAGTSDTNEGLSSCVAIGAEALQNFSSTGVTDFTGVVAIGFRAGKNSNVAGVGNPGNVFIGQACGENADVANAAWIGAVTGGPRDSVIIGNGSAANPAFGARDIVVIGIGATLSGATSTGTVLIGTEATTAGGARCVYVGGGTHTLTGDRNICVGYGAGNGEAAANTDRFIAEYFLGGTRNTMLYGDMSTGNLITGRSIPGTNRDLGGAMTNGLKLLDGVAPTVNPTGGGFLYVTAGALNWRGSAGTITPLAPA